MADIEGLDRAAGRLEEELERHLQDLRAVRHLLQGTVNHEESLRDRLQLVADGAGAAAHIFNQQIEDSEGEVPTAEEVLSTEE